MRRVPLTDIAPSELRNAVDALNKQKKFFQKIVRYRLIKSGEKIFRVKHGLKLVAELEMYTKENLGSCLTRFTIILQSTCKELIKLLKILEGDFL